MIRIDDGSVGLEPTKHHKTCSSARKLVNAERTPSGTRNRSHAVDLGEWAEVCWSPSVAKMKQADYVAKRGQRLMTSRSGGHHEAEQQRRTSRSGAAEDITERSSGGHHEAKQRRTSRSGAAKYITKRSSEGHHEAEQQVHHEAEQRRTSRSEAAAEKEVDDVAKQGQRLMSLRSRSKSWREAPCARGARERPACPKRR